MQIKRTLRVIIPICSMLLALGTVAFQNIEYSQEQEVLRQQQEKHLHQTGDSSHTTSFTDNKS